ncbi:MAG TPA: HAMP domain-containing sensor histidine kinase [Bacillota bacterium]|nr:HAMP domain-containing sensor histidine kinase [Bacillota bacterium]
MRTLYVRIIATTMFIMVASSVIGFVVTNVHYHHFLKPQNDQKITEIAYQIADMYEKNSNQPISEYLQSISQLGYKLHMIDAEGHQQSFGKPFSDETLEDGVVPMILQGETFHGIESYPWRPFVTGFFDHTLGNTIGVPVEVEGETKALFVRPYMMQQFGELRVFLAILLMLLLFISFIIVIISTRYLVKPIQTLTEATHKIAAGNYHIKLNVNRKDEIGRLAQDFSQMSSSLERTEEKREEFVASVSHEIQSPLTSIQGFSQALREEDIPRSEQERYLSIIEKESRRLSVLSNQLLTLSFLDSETDLDQWATFDLDKQLKEVISATEWQWREKNLSISFENEHGCVPVQGNPKLLYQVWMNLITNAIKYTPEDGEITVAIFEHKDEVEVRVSDTGVGIGQEEMTQLFDRFYRGDKARTRSDHSTGLGLSIAKKIIELHEGTIFATSKVGEGSTFITTLKKTEEESRSFLTK